ncbi:hsp70 family protein [Thiotrichales bacterium 19S9-12]|nr:hsp70 family protein [Thiotrichales bacterium 19S9-11]MCF6811440.1 hsp70 family protein [Thiotrichales bacterium 19S9-12]
MHPRFLVGIDLGTSNIALSYIDKLKNNDKIQLFKIPQYIAAGQIAELSELPAYYLPTKDHIFDLEQVRMPWQKEKAIVGFLAKDYAKDYPTLIIKSAKSYLSHPVLDIYSKFLPLGSYEQEIKISPVEVISCYLNYLIGAWNDKNPSHLLQDQQVVITVPASFNDQARQVTREIAEKVGFKFIELLEEPVACFYHWLETHAIDSADASTNATDLALVIDIGGGTTDLSLIQLSVKDGEFSFTRIATGEHLLLGGDNMDYFLLKLLSEEVNTLPSNAKQYLWVNQIQQAKENLLKPAEKNHSIRISLTASKSKLIKNTQTVSLTQTHIEQLLNGFFPLVQLKEPNSNKKIAGLRQFGLPFEQNPKITEHIADFLLKNAESVRESLKIDDNTNIPIPNVVLFNGGIFHSQLFAKRIESILTSWCTNKKIETLFNSQPSLAVCLGATSYLKAKNKQKNLIKVTATANYFIQVAQNKGLCILAKGTPHGISKQLKTPLKLKHNQESHFPLFRHRGNQFDLEEITNLNEDYEYVGSISHTFNHIKTDQTVTLKSQINASGLLELNASDKNHNNYLLKYNLNSKAPRLSSNNPRPNELINKGLIEQIKLKIESFFLDKEQSITYIKQQINTINGPIDKYTTSFARALWDKLINLQHLRFKRAEAEQFFYFLSGKLLNPGFGDVKDKNRIQMLAKLYNKGLEYTKSNACHHSWWVMWRRIAGGLDCQIQSKIYHDIQYALLIKTKQISKKNQIALDEKIRLLSVLEKLPLNLRINLGNELIKRIFKNPDSPTLWWALSRVGNRQPLSEHPGELIPCDIVTQWVEQLNPTIQSIKTRKSHKFIAHALILIARKIDDPIYQLDKITQNQIIKYLQKLKADAKQVKLISSIAQLDQQTSSFLFANDVPLGLTL